MAGGPLYPISMVPVLGDAGDVLYVRTGTTQELHFRGIGVPASITSDAMFRLLWRIPDPVPSGTFSLDLDMISQAQTGIAKIEPKWRAFSTDTNLTGTAVSTEGLTPTARIGGNASTDTMQWEAGDDGRILTARWTLDAVTAPTAGQYVLMDLLFESTGWTLAQTLVTFPTLVWV